MLNWKEQVEEFRGELVASPTDSEDKRTFNGTAFEYVAKFGIQEDFEDVVSTREEEISNYECHHVNGECFAYFSTREVEPYEE